jgi:hypothetical protein
MQERLSALIMSGFAASILATRSEIAFHLRLNGRSPFYKHQLLRTISHKRTPLQLDDLRGVNVVAGADFGEQIRVGRRIEIQNRQGHAAFLIPA